MTYVPPILKQLREEFKMTPPFKRPLQPPSVLCMGTPGSGKTYALASLINAGLELFVIVTEPGGVESLIDACEATGADINRLHWSSCLPITPGWDSVIEMATTIGTMSFDQIAAIKTGVGKTHTRPAGMNILNTMKNFKCERTGEAYGDVTLFGADRALALDSMSGLNTISMMLSVGHKPSPHQGEWGMSMNFIETVLLKLTSDRHCYFILNAHVEKELNELTGGSQIMVSTLGKKLAPKIPRFFSEVVLAQRLLDKGEAQFTWSTIDSRADLKNRSFPISTSLRQDYAPLVTAYKRRLELASVSSPAEPLEGTKPTGASAQISAIVSKAQPALVTLTKKD